jgi:SAM-dependent methyltransferase
VVALNLACGIYYISNSDWVNVDWEANSSNVQQMNLSKPLRFENEKFDFVYTSHFIEHTTYLQAEMLLKECYRVLSPGGIIHIITPDFEKICREYLRQIESGSLQKSEFVKFTLIDQMVRNKPGGESGAWRALSQGNTDLKEFMSLWAGAPVGHRQSKSFAKSRLLFFWKNITRALKNPHSLKRNALWKYYKMISLFFPKWFRDQHIAFCRPGERHLYLFDFKSLKALMEKVRFTEILRSSAGSSISGRNDFLQLDLDLQGNPRKVEESMYIEARKTINLRDTL